MNQSTVHPREIFKHAFLESAYSIIIMHNHPSGDITPSKADYLITDKIYEAAEIMGIELLDHIIIGNNNYESILYGRERRK